MILGSAITARELAANQSSGDEKNCIVYSLFCTCIMIIIIINISISVSFFALLNCLYLNPWVSPFVHFSSARCWGEREGWASGCL